MCDPVLFGLLSKCTATHCHALQHPATNCSTLQHTNCNTLQHTHTVLQGVAWDKSVVNTPVLRPSNQQQYYLSTYILCVSLRVNLSIWTLVIASSAIKYTHIKRCVFINIGVLLCIAACCSVLQCVAVCWSMLEYVAVCCSQRNSLYLDPWDRRQHYKVYTYCMIYIYKYALRVAVHRLVMQCVAVCCSVLQCVAVRVNPSIWDPCDRQQHCKVYTC